MKKGGLADSPFFEKQMAKASQAESQAAGHDQAVDVVEPAMADSRQPSKIPVNDDQMVDAKYDTVIPRHHDTNVETIRRAVKQHGKEAATHRFTPAEKEAIADIVYAYKRRGIRTSENELARIAINLLVEEHRIHGRDSLLERVLQALNA